MKFKNEKFILLFLISNLTVVTGISCGQKEKSKDTEPSADATTEALSGTRENSETYARIAKKNSCAINSPKDTNKRDSTTINESQAEGSKGDTKVPNLENSELKGEGSGKNEVTKESPCAK